MSSPNVLRPRPRPTQKDYRARVADVIRNVKAEHRLSNRGLADRIGCSEETVSNAENERNDLKALILLSIEHEFGPGTIDLVRELSGARGVPIGAVCDTDALPPLTAAVHSIAAARSRNSLGGERIVNAELRDMEPFLREAISALNGMLAMLERDAA